MKKIIAFAFIACTLYNHNSLCMLTRILYRQKQIQPPIRSYHARPYYIEPCIPQLPADNLFNTPELDKLSRAAIAALVHDVHDRNEQFKWRSNKQDTILEQQTDILVTFMTGHADKLDAKEVFKLEGELRNTLSQSKGHANE